MRSSKSLIGFKIQILIEADEQGFHAYCPALKGLHTCGDSKKEALENAKDAAGAYLQSLVKHGDPIPVGITVYCEEPNVKSGISWHNEELKVACPI